MTGPVRLDGFLRDGDGYAYWLMAAGLPGFGEFRYPAKFMTFAALGIAGLAGFGWDLLVDGHRRRRVLRTASLLLVLTLIAGVVLAATSDRFVSWVGSHPMAEQGELRSHQARNGQE